MKEAKLINGTTNYFIYNDGRVYNKKKGKFLKLMTNMYGYQFVNISINGVHCKKLVHRLVAEYFVSGNKKLTVNHIDGNKKNNHHTNLEWLTVSENNKHAYKNGLKNNSCQNHPRAKLNDIQVRIIRRSKKLLTAKYLSETFNVHPSTVNRIWQEKGYAL